MAAPNSSRVKAVLDEFDLEGTRIFPQHARCLFQKRIQKARALLTLLAVETRCQEMESCAHRLQQNMRDQFRIQLMKLPASIRKMPVSEFVEVYHADVNAVVSAEVIKSKNQAVVGSTPGPGPAAVSRTAKGKRGESQRTLLIMITLCVRSHGPTKQGTKARIGRHDSFSCLHLS